MSRKQKVDYCSKCDEVTNQNYTNGSWYCTKCQSFISSSITFGDIFKDKLEAIKRNLEK